MTSEDFSHKLEKTYEDITAAYHSDGRPWIIGYSGGKDSTTVVQAVWYALRESEREVDKPVYIVSADTRIEIPGLKRHVENACNRINEVAREEDLPFQAEKVYPVASDTYWTNLIGRGYPAPHFSFRWCTERLKIKPMQQFVQERLSDYGQVIVLLGTRKSESQARARAMEKNRIFGYRFKKHPTMSNAFVYAPIAGWTTKDVWTYLLEFPSPWGGDNRELVSLYRQTHRLDDDYTGERSSPFWGDSRFGCWACTLVDEDKAVKGLIDSGEKWLEPLLEFRNLLKKTQDPELKPRYRSHRHLDGKIYTKDKDGTLSYGPYRCSFCKSLLKRLLKIQEVIRKDGPDPDLTLISDDELHEIRRIWRIERHDWRDSVPEIYEEVTGEDLGWKDDDLANIDRGDAGILKEVCDRNSVSPEMVQELLGVERKLWGMARRASIFDEIESVFRMDWQSEKEVVADLENRHEGI